MNSSAVDAAGGLIDLGYDFFALMERVYLNHESSAYVPSRNDKRDWRNNTTNTIKDSL
jgi:hypothetical protein